jgi:hypothetical protein
MQGFTMLRRLAQRFRRDETGSITVESMLILPILIWCYLGTFVFFDGFRAQSINIKAGYTLGDTLSRETGYVTPEYMDSLFSLQQFLVDTVEPVQLRITVFRYTASDDSYRVRWSQARGGATALTTAGLGTLRDFLPDMADNDIAILTETWVGYEPAFDVGIQPFTFSDLVVTRPRFASQLCWNSVNDGTLATATC